MSRLTTSQPRVRASSLTKAQLIVKLDHLERTVQKYQKLLDESSKEISVRKDLNVQLLKEIEVQSDLYKKLDFYRLAEMRRDATEQHRRSQIDSFSDGVLSAKLTMFVQNPRLRENAEHTIKRLLEEWVNRTNLAVRKRHRMLSYVRSCMPVHKPIAYDEARQYFDMRCQQEDERRADLYFDSQHKEGGE